jgi:hypothetical protein
VLFNLTWEFNENSEEEIQRSLGFFSQWKPPEGFEFKGFWGYADGSGGTAIVEVDDATAIARATAPFGPWIRFNIRPVLPSRNRQRSVAKPSRRARRSATR